MRSNPFRHVPKRRRRPAEPTVPNPTDLAGLQDESGFHRRHLGPDDADRRAMLEVLGVEDVATLLDRAVPASIRDDQPLDLPAPASEATVLARLRELAARNTVRKAFVGLGYHGTVTPPVIRRNVLEDPGWYTAYTPYQPEISQGRLEALLVFQTMVRDLTGMDLAGASLLDEATAAAEGLTLCHRVSRKQGPDGADASALLIDVACHPQTIAVVRTRALPLGLRVHVADLRDADVLAGLDLDDVVAALVQQPTTDGLVVDDTALIERLHDADVLVTVATDLFACTLVTPPGEQGADVVVGSTQRFGVPMMYGGPHAAFLATRDRYARNLPGRLVGVSVDTAGREAYRLALQTREQHIRREKATSNICTSQVLLAVVAAMYAVHHGPGGLQRIARRMHAYAGVLRELLVAADLEVRGDTWFDTLTVTVPGRADAVLRAAADAGYELGRVPADDTGAWDADHVRVAFDETTNVADLAAVARVLTGEQVSVADVEARLDGGQRDLAAGLPGVPDGLRRTSDFLTDARFHRYRSETELLRWLRSLKAKDVALDRAMIPLGSCTMKLNATAEMEAITWPAFADLHPFVPVDRSPGTRQVIADLEHWLAEITGYDAVSLQPNAGSQGELAGLLAIRGYHRANDDDGRDVCLIPSSAHGTNAASAVMAGMRVKVVACDEDGNVDVDDLKRLVTEHADHLAALMVTYPSTHGVFERRIGDICALVHDHGGQVYLDGANLNALVGVARPGRFGADVSHLNLHKTFCIPHGGGGPGVGPVGCRSHLAPYLPTHPLVPESGHAASRDVEPELRTGPVAAAPWGSAGILQISWAYIALMGASGLRAATETAILNANYVAARLADGYPVLYTGENGLVAHEAIVDVRGWKERSGITNEDVAKRLIDHGFHAPTMSFPVAGTLMIEPTESESKAELDRFCDAMLAIRAEEERVEAGEWPRDDNPLVNAPHPAEDLLADEWSHPYGRREAAYPAGVRRDDKYWPPVSRIDNAHGDRNLVCACPAPEAFAD
ncbi:aminomethyl-transferring glycine dehydrogenase [Egicoccus sp. AB-alg2]|uniref:aminomethyl-transferring glycine dehydrogenase n=1 Tax=Egicoccus sp. AB-alg2 TaxID=3242693 RepID=UPI00359D9344